MVPMSQRTWVAAFFAVAAAAVFVLDSTAGRIATAFTNPSNTTLLEAVVSVGGALAGGGTAAVFVWVLTTMLLPDEAFVPDEMFAEVTDQLAVDQERVVADAERIIANAAERDDL